MLMLSNAKGLAQHQAAVPRSSEPIPVEKPRSLTHAGAHA